MKKSVGFLVSFLLVLIGTFSETQAQHAPAYTTQTYSFSYGHEVTLTIVEEWTYIRLPGFGFGGGGVSPQITIFCDGCARGWYLNSENFGLSPGIYHINIVESSRKPTADVNLLVMTPILDPENPKSAEFQVEPTLGRPRNYGSASTVPPSPTKPYSPTIG